MHIIIEYIDVCAETDFGNIVGNGSPNNNNTKPSFSTSKKKKSSRFLENKLKMYETEVVINLLDPSRVTNILSLSEHNNMCIDKEKEQKKKTTYCN